MIEIEKTLNSYTSKNLFELEKTKLLSDYMLNNLCLISLIKNDIILLILVFSTKTKFKIFLASL
jgi:hypothetical protein